MMLLIGLKFQPGTCRNQDQLKITIRMQIRAQIRARIRTRTQMWINNKIENTFNFHSFFSSSRFYKRKR
jgi:hypothetical protein